jgi:cytochrome c-type biogenesis protein CcmF
VIPEIGQFALILALCVALIQTVLPIVGAHIGKRSWVAVAVPATRVQLLFVGIAFAILTYSFIVHDFSVRYVAMHSNSELPLIYRISGVWGGHEGSLLLWALVLALWAGAVSVFSRNVPEDMLARVLGVLGFVSIGFLLFMLFTSNPFDRQFPVPLDGRDLNPLLQDPGLAIHPPMLYMGYVGFSVAFAFAIAALLSGRLDTAWARWSRPWTNAAWLFLTAGIALGSWWAYYELGWGGWWFWDPVENASFMPWLVGTALMHSLAATEKRGAFKAWTVLLAILAFSLSLLGTFLVRSGVLTSVHAFATDPERGVFILMFLGVVIGGSLLLYAWRAPRIKSSASYQMVSRETALLLNNVLLVATTATILLGTLYPLVLDALGVGKISVGPPYFNAVFVPLMAPLALLVGFGALARWKQDSFGRLERKLRWALIASVVVGAFLPVVALPHYSWGAALGIVLAIWVTLTAAVGVYDRIANKTYKLRALGTIPRGFWGMTLGHVGIAVFIVGVTLTSIYSVEEDVRMSPGDAHELAGYEFRFEGVRDVEGPNYFAQEGTLRAFVDGREVALLSPQKRIYRVQQSPMTEAAIDAGLTRDLFVALGDPLGETGAWSLRLYHKPFIRWIWLGTIFMTIGGLLAATDKRYRAALKRAEEPAAGLAVGTR